MAPRVALRRLLTILIALSAIALFMRFIPTLVRTLNTHPYDGKVDWLAARAFLAHQNPYSPEFLSSVKLDGLGHPPTTSFWFLPLAHLDLQAMSQVVGHLTVLIVLFTCLLLFMEMELGASLWLPLSALCAALLLNTEWMRFHLHLAQISATISFVLLLMWLALRRGEEVLGGLLLGAACTMKLFPGMLALFLLLGRRFRCVAAAVAFYLAVAALMTSRFGLVCWQQFARSEKIIVDYWIGNMRNASLHGLVLRAFHPVCRGQSSARPYATLIATALGCALFALAYWLWRRLPAERRAQVLYRTDVPCALFITLGIFCNPFVYEHYHVLLVPPLLVAVYTCWRLRGEIGGTWLLPCAALLLSTVGLLFYEPWTRLSVVQLRTPAHHMRQHLLEVANALPYMLLPALFMLLLARAGMKGRSSPISE